MILKISHYYCYYSPSLHVNAGLWDSSTKYQLGSARGPLQYMVSITYYVKLEIPTYITQPMCIDIIPACSFVTCLLEVPLLWELHSSTLFHVESMNNIWLKVKRYVLKVYNNKLLEHSQYSLQFFSAVVNIFFSYVVTQSILI